MHKNIIVEKGSVSTIVADGVLIGVIFHDQKSHNKVCYKVVEMDEDDIAELMTKTHEE